MQLPGVGMTAGTTAVVWKQWGMKRMEWVDAT
ncbi:hypothetical protein RCH14_002316 [Massilia sp. MP_M2]